MDKKKYGIRRYMKCYACGYRKEIKQAPTKKEFEQFNKSHKCEPTKEYLKRITKHDYEENKKHKGYCAIIWEI